MSPHLKPYDAALAPEVNLNCSIVNTALIEKYSLSAKWILNPENGLSMLDQTSPEKLCSVYRMVRILHAHYIKRKRLLANGLEQKKEDIHNLKSGTHFIFIKYLLIVCDSFSNRRNTFHPEVIMARVKQLQWLMDDIPLSKVTK